MENGRSGGNGQPSHSHGGYDDQKDTDIDGSSSKNDRKALYRTHKCTDEATRSKQMVKRPTEGPAKTKTPIASPSHARQGKSKVLVA